MLNETKELLKDYYGIDDDTFKLSQEIMEEIKDKFEEIKEEVVWADEHRIGISKDLDSEILEGLRANFMGECTEVGMYLAMARQADREGYPEVAEAYTRIAYEEAEHAAKNSSGCCDALVCQVETCIYNENKLCSADCISVSGNDPSIYTETACKTFKSR